MNFKRPIKHIRRFIRKIFYIIFQSVRHIKYHLLSENTIIGSVKCYQPTIFNGEGDITIGENVKIGVIPAKDFYNGYCYIDAKTKEATIKIHDNIHINNNCSIVSNQAAIEICSYTLIGANVSISDSDFHNLDPSKRLSGQSISKKVFIGENVFIGSNTTILKGVSIGKNSVIANSSVVTKSFPENVIIGGNPAKIIRSIS